jgi:serine phosphatase RsbU (regulator of sigma subunit)
MINLWNKIVNYNVDNIAQEWDKRNMRLMNSLIFLLSVVSITFSFISYSAGIKGSAPLAFVIALLPVSHFLFFYRFNIIFIKVYFCFIPPLLTFLLAVFFIGEGGGDKYYLLNTLILPLVVFKKKREYFPIVILNIIMFFLIEYFQNKIDPYFKLNSQDLFYYFLLTSFLIFVLSYLIISLFKKEIYSFQRTINNQRKVLEEKNNEIVDSLIYAKGIQEAILPSQLYLKTLFENGFIIYLPKDIVAGDFYWIEESNNNLYFAAADCTGHGVPGAMVSLVCEKALDQSLREHHLTDVNAILEKTSELISATFSKSEREIKDGMDISICRLNQQNNTLQYSGANNPLWIISSNESLQTEAEYKSLETDGVYLHEIKATKRSVGNSYSQEPFALNTIQLEVGDKIILLTDGYPDQFGGEKGKKFKYLPLKKLILQSNYNDLKSILEVEFNNWKDDLEQVDDVCLIGYEIK